MNKYNYLIRNINYNNNSKMNKYNNQINKNNRKMNNYYKTNI